MHAILVVNAGSSSVRFQIFSLVRAGDPQRLIKGLIKASCRMMEAAKYSTVEALRDGSSVEIRALKAADREDMLAAVSRISGESLHRRFFAAKRHFSESEKAFFLNVDFVDHVALVAIAKEGGRQCVVGGGRYIIVRPVTAELAFAVIDEYQGRGIGSALMRHLILLGRHDGIREFVAEVLAENISMLKVLQTSGLSLQVERRAGVIHATLNL